MGHVVVARAHDAERDSLGVGAGEQVNMQGTGSRQHGGTLTHVLNGSNFLVLEGSGPETAQLRRVFGQHGTVCVVSGVSAALHELSTNPSLVAAGLTWSLDAGRLLREAWVTRPGRFSLLVVCSSPTTEIVRQVFYAQERGRFDVRLVCAPVADEDVHLFISSGLHRRQARNDRPQNPDVGATLGRRVGLTSREMDVLRCALSGVARSSMVQTLSVRPSTLRSHARAILGKFMVRYPQYPVRNLVELVNVLLLQAPELTSEEESHPTPKALR
jgi:DNA-binding CsgD family transcriptional regulator